MKFIKQFSATLALFCFANTSSAAIIDQGDVTYDTVSGFEWLDLSFTTGMSYSDVFTAAESGGALESWTYARTTEVIAFWESAVQPNSYAGYTFTSAQNQALWDSWGASSGQGFLAFTTRDTSISSFDIAFAGVIGPGQLDCCTANIDIYSSDGQTGAALYRTPSAVPIPAAVWLFGSGLIGLVGLARRKKAV